MTTGELTPLRHCVSNIVEKSDGSAAPFIGLEQVESRTGRVTWTEVALKAASDALRHRPGDVLFSKLRPYLAKGFVATQTGTATSELVVLRPNHLIDSRYLGYVMLSRQLLDWAEMTSYGSKMPRTSWEALADFRVFLPSLVEQRRIANFLDAETARIDALRSGTKREGALSRERLSVIITGSTSAISMWDKALPVGWQMLQLRRCLASTTYGIGFSTREAGPIPILGMGNVANGHIVGEPGGYLEDEEVPASLILQEGDLLFNRTNSLALVGKVAFWPGSTSVATSFASYLVLLRVNAMANAKYLNYLLNTEAVLGAARSMALPSIGQANLNPTRYSSMTIPLPGSETQGEIVLELDRAANHAAKVETALQVRDGLLVERRQALIMSAVTGQLDVSTAGRAA